MQWQAWQRLPGRWICTTAVFLAIGLLAGRIALTYRVFSETVDEPYHIGAAVSLYESRKLIHGCQHPPLPRLIAGLPLALAGVSLPELKNQKTIQWDIAAFDVGDKVLMHGHLSYWSVLTLARAPMLIFAIIAVVYAYLLGRYLAGPLVGCAAAMFFSTDPTLLGHASWVTNDVASAAGFLGVIYHGLRFLARRTWGHVIVAGIATGLGISCKFSVAMALPALLVIQLLRRRCALLRGRFRSYFGAWPAPRKLLVAGCCAFLTLWATYLFDIGRPDDLAIMPEPESTALNALPDWLRRTPIPMPSAVIGYLMLLLHTRLGHIAYLNGQFSVNGWWSYFPQALVMKSPLAMLAALTLSLGCLLLGRRRFRSLVILIPAALFMFASMATPINIGIRHILPAIALIYVLIAHELIRAGLGKLLIGLIVLAGIETGLNHPDYLAYFNLLFNEPDEPEKHLLDSNLDWGQDQWRLKLWLDQHARGRQVSLRIFGNIRLSDWPHEGYSIVPPGLRPVGLLAVSKNCLYELHPTYRKTGDGGLIVESPVGAARNLKPIAKIGRSINVYDLSQSVFNP